MYFKSRGWPTILIFSFLVIASSNVDGVPSAAITQRSTKPVSTVENGSVEKAGDKDTQTTVPDVRAEIVTTDNCHLDLRPALKEFLLDQTNGAQSYRNVDITFMQGQRPVLTILENDQILESIQLWNIETKAELHNMLKRRGFVQESNTSEEELKSNSKNTRKPDNTSAMDAARKAFKEAEKQQGSDTYAKSYAAMRAYLDASNRGYTDDNDTKKKIGNEYVDDTDVVADQWDWGYVRMTDLIHKRLHDHRDSDHNDKTAIM